MRDPSPDRNDRVRHTDKQNEDHTREPSPDRSSNEQYIQRAEYIPSEYANFRTWPPFIPLFKIKIQSICI
jgi:hypothetical protein